MDEFRRIRLREERAVEMDFDDHATKAYHGKYVSTGIAAG